ncbi:hypothetical protein JX265_011233 [Neoarthrinium moseri]|uniref:EthD domain-containing protein n=1 Tax=Neoarthrinium moseri TaxID=1658444 RepID=A0A9P9WD32_9PEZI|nr:hypothetical protein JX266_007959 [Neoarthrinium moseri]KAI1857498.1 hypothetical protein JX265_011233 [Neoarthrinium moseri]
MAATLCVAYPPGSDIDLDYYLEKHIPWSLELWEGDGSDGRKGSIIDWKVYTAAATSGDEDDNNGPSYELLFTCTWASREAMEAAQSAVTPKQHKEAWEDVANYSKKSPVVWIMEQKASS